MNETDGTMYCRECRMALNRSTAEGEPVRYFHAHAAIEAWEGEEHEPQPVLLSGLVDPQMFCDFCCRPGPTWRYTFVNVTGFDGTVDLGETWAACDDCAVLVEQRGARKMIARVRAVFREDGKPVAHLAALLRPVYQELFGNPFTRRPLSRS